jgi:hypothetical protein
MLVKFFQLLAALYASTHPHGTYTGIDIDTPSKASEPRVGGVAASHVREVKEEQFLKAEEPMLVTLLGIVIEVKDAQPSKAPHPILVTLLGIVTEVKDEQPWKAHSPMLVTLLGIVTEVKEKHS